MTVPLQDLERDQASMADALADAVREVFESSAFVLGPFVERFESDLAGLVGVSQAVGVGSGTDALLLALKALDVGPGDEVITTPFSFVSSGSTIALAGATPVFADIRPDTFNLDPGAVAAAITERTAAIVPVHLFGQMAEMGEIRALAARHGLAVVEDAAQAIGATQRLTAEGDPLSGTTVRAGAAGDAGCFSFYPTKNLGAWGDGGAVTTADAALAARLRSLRAHGAEPGDPYAHAEIGYATRLDAVQAAVLGVKLRELEGWTEKRRANAAAYDRALRDVEAITLPAVRAGNSHVYHQYTVRCQERPRVQAHLRDSGIGHAVYYPIPLHLQEAFAALGYRAGDFPEAERAAREVLSLPVFPTLTAEERDRVIASLRGG